MKILITGVAGFIGFHAAKESLLRGDDVIGVDSVNDYYDTLANLTDEELKLRFSNISDEFNLFLKSRRHFYHSI